MRCNVRGPGSSSLFARATDARAAGFIPVGTRKSVIERHKCSGPGLPLVLEVNARPGLAIQLANRRGLLPGLCQLSTLGVFG